MQNATATTPWIVTFLMRSGDAQPPAVQVRVPRRIADESARKTGLPVVVRSNKPARARAMLISKDGDRHALAKRRLVWANRGYRLTLRLSQAGRRPLDVGDHYKLRVRVTDRAGNRRTVKRRIVIH
jgi:hypothetical protein